MNWVSNMDQRASRVKYGEYRRTASRSKDRRAGVAAIRKRSWSLAPGSAAANGQRGVALLAVLWLAVALSFMGMATSELVRTEVAAVGNEIDWQRSYYLARGGIEAAIYSIAYPPSGQIADPEAPDRPFEFRPGKRWLHYQFPGGSCVVEISPENAKLNINQVPPEQLAALFAALGLSAEESLQVAAAIADWRTPRTSDVASILDAFYANLPEPYLARHAPLEQLDELLPVRGMDRRLFFGHLERNPEGGWQTRPPLQDLLTTQVTAGLVNPNYAPYEILRSLPGWDDSTASAVLRARAAAPFRSMEEVASVVPGISAMTSTASLTLLQGPVYTLTATGSVPGSRVRRSVRALVSIDARATLNHRILGWWDEWPSANEPPPSDATTNDTGSHS